MNRKYLILIVLITLYGAANAQLAGKNTFAFMNLQNSARNVALGGSTLSTLEKDISSVYVNPAALHEDHDKWLSFNYNNHIEGIQYGYIGMARKFKSPGMWSGGLFYVDYGKIDGYDEFENYIGEETAGEYCFNISHSRNLGEKFVVGASLKYVYSVISTYVANGAALDMGVTYNNKEKKMSSSLVLRNMGYQIVKYTDDGERENFPFGIHLGLTKELEHMPFRIHILLHDLQKFDLTYENTNVTSFEIDLETGEAVEEKSSLGDKLMRHLTIGGEFIIGPKRNFNLSFGYNHQKRKEIAPELRRGVTGFSWGIGFRVSKLHLSYGSSSYFPGFNVNQFSVNLNLDQLKKKKS